MRKGYITVYLSLTLIILIALITTLIEGVKINAEKMKTSVAADICIDSALSEYNRELFRQYDLLFIDMSYGASEGSKLNVENRLNYYLTKNLCGIPPQGSIDIVKVYPSQVSIEAYSLATDNEAEAIKYQVKDYINTFYDGNLDSGYDDITDELNGAGYSYDVEGLRSEVQAEIEEIGLPVIVNEYGVEEEILLGNPADNVNSLRETGILGIVLGNPEDVSTVGTNVLAYASNRDLKTANGLSEDERSVISTADKFLFTEYLFDKYGYWNSEKEDGLMKYQIEYVISGLPSDLDNLENVCRTIVMWREAVNFTYLLNDMGKQAEAEEMANSLAAVILLPELAEPVKWSILIAWAYVEALQDTKILLEDGAVMTAKTLESWRTSLTDILNPLSSLHSYSDQEGKKYGDYLKTILLLDTYSKILLKSMDIMEMDIRKTPGNSHFCIDNCMNGYQALIETQTGRGRKIRVRRKDGYYCI